MSFFSDLSRKLGFTSDADDQEELDDSDLPEEDEEEEEEEEERSSARFPNPFRARQQSTRPAVEEEEEPAARSQRRGTVIHDERMENRARQGGASEAEPYTHCERIVRVRQIEECREIIRYLLQGESVLLNLENIDPKDCGRVVDLLSGAAFALQGRMLKVAHLSYLLAPENVEIIETDLYNANRAYYR